MLSAAPERLDAVGGAGSGRILATVREILARLVRKEIEDRPLLGAATELDAYLRVAMAHSPREEARILYLDATNRLIADEQVASGTVNQVAIFPREIIRRSLELAATGIILVHNHPSGDPAPSREDIRITQQLAHLAGGFDIRLHDHIIIARCGHASLRAMGIL